MELEVQVIAREPENVSVSFGEKSIWNSLIVSNTNTFDSQGNPRPTSKPYAEGAPRRRCPTVLQTYSNTDYRQKIQEEICHI